MVCGPSNPSYCSSACSSSSSLQSFFEQPWNLSPGSSVLLFIRNRETPLGTGDNSRRI
jgi:hypothetical protein